MKIPTFLIIFVSVVLLFQTLNGQTWTSAKRITWSPEDSTSPDVASDSNGYIHVAWIEGPYGDCEIYYKKCTDNATIWEGAKRLTWMSSVDKGSLSMNLDASDNIHMVWADNEPGNYEI